LYGSLVNIPQKLDLLSEGTFPMDCYLSRQTEMAIILSHNLLRLKHLSVWKGGAGERRGWDLYWMG